MESIPEGWTPVDTDWLISQMFKDYGTYERLPEPAKMHKFDMIVPLEGPIYLTSNTHLIMGSSPQLALKKVVPTPSPYAIFFPDGRDLLTTDQQPIKSPARRFKKRKRHK
jgi:hypothetical protein